MSGMNYWERRVSRRTALRGSGLAVAGLAGAALVGCGDDDSPGTPGPGGTPAPGATATPDLSDVRAGGHLRAATTLEPSTLDPVRAVSGGDDVFNRPMFDYLLARDHNDEIDLNRSLAENYEVQDETTIVLNLRDGVEFHNGDAFNAEDVVWNHSYVTDPDVGSVSRQTYLIINEIETPDDRTAILHLERPNADLLVSLGGRGGQILSRRAKEEMGDEFGAQPVGTGPFVYQEFVSGSHLTVRNNPNYWRQDAQGTPIPYLENVTLRVVPDDTVRLSALTTGDIELGGVAARDLEQAEANPDLEVSVREGVSTASCIIQNRDIGPTDNKELRQAVNWAVNPAAVQQAVFFGRGASVADGSYSPPATWAHIPIPGSYEYDPQRARDLLAAAGYPDGLDIETITYSAPNIVQKTEIYQAQLAEVGINWRVKTGDVGSATQEFFEGRQMPTYSTSWGAGSAPDGLIRGFLGDAAFYNVSQQEFPEMQELLDRAVAVFDQEERMELYRQIYEMALDDAMWVPKLYGNAFVAVNNRIQNVEQLYFGLNAWRFEDLWLES